MNSHDQDEIAVLLRETGLFMALLASLSSWALLGHVFGL